ncbi:MAG: ABC transporter ATP-binding protein [Elusimicrobia bacterium]|nr:ABC transporter ATP-binding protein [Elusimicrobiota bacterium]
MPLVELIGLRREFGDTVAVRDVDLAIEEGAVFALVGPNGAGKTTLLRMVAALLEPTAGTARIDGCDVRRQPREVHARLGYLPDFFGLYPQLTARQYLEYFYLAYRLDPDLLASRVEAALSQVGLQDRARSQIATLSRGMAQRLGLARTLLHDPPLLLLDEPAAGLDPGSRIELQDTLKALAAAGKTILVSSHILAELEDYCSHMAILDSGALVYAGTVERARKLVAKTRRLKLRVVDGLAEALAALEADPLVEDLKGDGNLATFAFGGSEAQEAELLRSLVEQGVRVSAFAEEAGTIQDSYLAIMGRDS